MCDERVKQGIESCRRRDRPAKIQQATPQVITTPVKNPVYSLLEKILDGCGDHYDACHRGN